MTLEIGILLTAMTFGILGLGLSWFFYKNSKHHRDLLEFLGKQVEDLEESLTENNGKLVTSSQRVTDQSRRIAWLETRVRQPKKLQEEVLEEKILKNPSRPNMTERRHRVLTLASRGQDAKRIASTLGMMPGEVELIINLSRITV